MEKGGKMEEKRRKIVKGKVENWKWKEGKVLKWGEDLFFFFFFFFFWLFKTTKICFGATKMEIFYREKAFHARKKIRKNDCFQKNYPVTPLNLTQNFMNSGVLYLHIFKEYSFCLAWTIFQKRDYVTTLFVGLRSP